MAIFTSKASVLDRGFWRRLSANNYVGGAFFAEELRLLACLHATQAHILLLQEASQPQPKTGIIAGVVVGCVLVLSAIITFSLLRRRRKARSAPALGIQIDKSMASSSTISALGTRI